MDAGVSWNYTTWLNIVFLILAAVLVARFVRTGGLGMLRMMGGSPDTDHGDGHVEHPEHGAPHHGQDRPGSPTPAGRGGGPGHPPEDHQDIV